MKKIVISLITVLALTALLTVPELAYEAKAFTEEETEWIEEAQDVLAEVLEQKDILALVYLTDEYTVRSEASLQSAQVTTVNSGQTVHIVGMKMTEEYEPWIQVEFSKQDVSYTGYIERSYLACSDELFLQWEMNYGMNPGAYASMFALEESEVQVHADIEQFPESYHEALTALKEAHPNWIFVKMDTGLEWDTVVSEELYGGRSLVPTSLSGALQEGNYSKGWAYATEEALEYYLDPRNGLTESGIFQFEQLTFNASYHETCETALQSFLDNTFMKGNVPGWEPSGKAGTYAYAFWVIGKNMNISPFHLASRVYQEQGQGTSPLISGTYPGFEGYYNYFNIGASGTTDKAVIESGLTYAKEATPPWDTHYYALHFGAKTLGANYINKGQDTLYLQKFDVDDSSSGMFWHQYMQNICAPFSEAKSIRKLYEEVGALDNIFVFKIPVYNNMPETCPLPATSDRVILGAADGYNDATIWLDGVAYTAEKRNGYYIAHAADMNAKTAVMYEYNDAGTPIGMKVWSLSSDGVSYKATELTELEDLLTYHGFSIRITGRSGIRHVSSIDETVKKKLANEGIKGYTLKEYGTLVMLNENRSEYSMIKDGEKVMAGMAYGIDSEGNPVDIVFETVDGRQRFAYVIVGVPCEEYKTNLAFRGYATLTKGNEEIIIYGPIMHRSIYRVAEQMIEYQWYEEGSSAQLFLKQLIIDGDSATLENAG